MIFFFTGYLNELMLFVIVGVVLGHVWLSLNISARYYKLFLLIVTTYLLVAV